MSKGIEKYNDTLLAMILRKQMEDKKDERLGKQFEHDKDLKEIDYQNKLRADQHLQERQNFTKAVFGNVIRKMIPADISGFMRPELEGAILDQVSQIPGVDMDYFTGMLGPYLDNLHGASGTGQGYGAPQSTMPKQQNIMNELNSKNGNISEVGGNFGLRPLRPTNEVAEIPSYQLNEMKDVPLYETMWNRMMRAISGEKSNIDQYRGY